MCSWHLLTNHSTNYCLAIQVGLKQIAQYLLASILCPTLLEMVRPFKPFYPVICSVCRTCETFLPIMYMYGCNNMTGMLLWLPKMLNTWHVLRHLWCFTLESKRVHLVDDHAFHIHFHLFLHQGFYFIVSLYLSQTITFIYTLIVKSTN